MVVFGYLVWDLVPPVSPTAVSAPGTAPAALIDNPAHATWEAEVAAWDSPIGTAYPAPEPAELMVNPAYAAWVIADAAYTTYLAAVVAYDAAVIVWAAYLVAHPGWVAPLRSYVSVDNVVTWTGPGTGAADDPSWFTSWITLDPPAAPGQRRIVNIRFVCRENWFIGEVPQVTGSAVELPPP